MARLTIVVPDEVAKDLRRKAIELYGGEKGWLGMAIADAIRLWLKQPVDRRKK